MGNATVYFARWILSDDVLIENAAVRVVDDVIERVGYKTGIRQSSDDRIVNLGNRILLPGLINLHTRLEEGILRNSFPRTIQHFDFLESCETQMQTAPLDRIRNSVSLNIREALANGITTQFSTIDRLSPEDYAEQPGRTLLLKKIRDRPYISRQAFAQKIHEYLVSNPQISGITPGNLYNIPPQWLKEVLRFIPKTRSLFAMHLGQDHEEIEAFVNNKGSIFEKRQKENRWFYGKESHGPLWYAISNNLIPPWSVILNPTFFGAEELSSIAACRSSVAISPRYNHFFGLPRFPLETALNRQVNTVIVTETPAVSKSLNLLDELFVLRQDYPTIPAKELLALVTHNPARILRRGHQLGSIAPGKKADIIGLTIDQLSGNPLEDVISGNSAVEFVIVDGKELLIP